MNIEDNLKRLEKHLHSLGVHPDYQYTMRAKGVVMEGWILNWAMGGDKSRVSFWMRKIK